MVQRSTTKEEQLFSSYDGWSYRLICEAYEVFFFSVQSLRELICQNSNVKEVKCSYLWFSRLQLIIFFSSKNPPKISRGAAKTSPWQEAQISYQVDMFSFLRECRTWKFVKLNGQKRWKWDPTGIYKTEASWYLLIISFILGYKNRILFQYRHLILVLPNILQPINRGCISSKRSGQLPFSHLPNAPNRNPRKVVGLFSAEYVQYESWRLVCRTFICKENPIHQILLFFFFLKANQYNHPNFLTIQIGYIWYG